MTPAYLAEVERAFVQHAGRGLFLSPMDRQRVAGWARAGIPAAVVVAGIEQAFDRPDVPRVRGLGYAAPAIEERIKAWQHAQIGRRRESAEPSQAMQAALDRLVAQVEAAGRQADGAALTVLRSMWRAIADLRTRWSAGSEPDPIKALFETELRLLDEALGAVDPATRAGIEDEVATTLDGFSIHDDETRRITRRALLHDALRRHLGLPALELRL